MNMYLLPIIAVLAGFLFFMLFRPHEKGKLKLLLAFSGAFLLAITVFEIIPSVFAEGYNPLSWIIYFTRNATSDNP